MKPLFYSLLCAATMFVSCTKDQEFEVLSNSEPKTLSNSKETKSSIEVLEFATEADFLKAVESPAAILNNLSDYSSFESLYDEFEKAWLKIITSLIKNIMSLRNFFLIYTFQSTKTTILSSYQLAMIQ